VSEYAGGPMDINILTRGATTQFGDSGTFIDYGNYTQRKVCAHYDCDSIITNRARYCSSCVKLATVRRTVAQMDQVRVMLGIEEEDADD